MSKKLNYKTRFTRTLLSNINTANNKFGVIILAIKFVTITRYTFSYYFCSLMI